MEGMDPKEGDIEANKDQTNNVPAKALKRGLKKSKTVRTMGPIYECF